MARITESERQRFHVLLDDSINKLDSDKNAKKSHWSEIKIQKLYKMLKVEVYELDIPMSETDFNGIESECNDIINFAMFIKDNIKQRGVMCL